MATHDYALANQSGSSFRTDLNNVLAAIVSNNSASSEPSTKYSYQYWADTSSGYLKIRNAANNAWIQLFKLDGTDLAGFCSLTGSTNNQITTVTGANAIQGESGLTFDGSTINFTAASGDARLTLIGTEGNDARISLVADDGDDHIDQYNIRSNADDNSFSIDQFESGSFVERFTIANGGNIGINNASPSVALDIIRSAVTNSDRNTDDALTIENNGTTNINLISAADNAGFLLFSDDVRAKAYVKYDHSAGYLEFKADGTACVRMQADNMNILDGNLIIGTAGHGIDFSATSDATGATSELLDDYEEGVYTPTFNSNLTINSSYDQFSYTRIGRVVTIKGLIYPSSVSGTDNVTMTLPFQGANGPEVSNSGPGTCMFNLIDGCNAGMNIFNGENATYCLFYRLEPGTSGWTALNNSHFNTSAEIYITHTYIAA